MRVLIFFLLVVDGLSGKELVYEAARAGNPLKGLVPYTNEWKKERFPHTMEFSYVPMGKLMKGWGRYDWSALEEILEGVKLRGKQTVFRVYLEYPGIEGAVPEFLVKEGVKVTEWEVDGKVELTPDYGDERLRKAMREFIAALGKRYDGDVRVGFVTMGMLGVWGEWHTFPREDLWASKEVQVEVMEAFDRAFNETHVLMRYPAGEGNYHYADNRKTGVGYHDDSFAWATRDTGKEEDGWFFVPAMKAAGLEGKWKEFPIGGEIRPEIWRTTFTDKKFGQEQDFMECVRETHVSWLMDSGVYQDGIPLPEERKVRAIKAVQGMGYELFVREVRMDGGELVVRVENRGVAPFYYDWSVEVRWSAPGVRTKPVFPGWRLSKVLPGEPVEWRLELGGEPTEVRIGVSNPMAGGPALRFANEEVEGDWLVVTF
ncbi:MAG: hypothetical protein ACSHYF_14390 [Verrucomicrobiaceae bacterium]